MQAMQNPQHKERPLPEKEFTPPDTSLIPGTRTDSQRVADEKASFSLQINDLVSPYQTLGIFVMPGEQIDLEAIFTRPEETYSLQAPGGDVIVLENGEWSWMAPEDPGAHVLFIEGPVDTMRLNVFVKTVFDNDDPVLKGYQIGAYEEKPLRQNPLFNPPAGLIEVNEKTADLRVSPHFTLGDFTCHQPGDPKYIVLDERLVIKLEMLLEEVRQQGIDATTFTIMSGYRTPWYNEQIGNETRYSLHLYGRASDIYIDEDRNSLMDDLNKDGRTDIQDARLLFSIAEKMDQQPWYQPFVGGLGLYGPKPHRGAFLHVDVRGYTARW
jgi:hypothetical protein